MLDKNSAVRYSKLDSPVVHLVSPTKPLSGLSHHLFFLSPQPPRVYPQSSTAGRGSPRTLGVTCSPLTSWATRPGRRRTRRSRRRRRRWRWRWRRGRCWSWSRWLRVELLWTRSLVSEWAFWKLKHRIKTSYFLLNDAMFWKRHRPSMFLAMFQKR